MARRNVYLGTRVPDVGKKGLDSPSEFEAIMREILKDVQMGVIPRSKAHGRLLLLYRLTSPRKNKKVKGWSKETRKRIRKEIREAMDKLDEFNTLWNL